MRARHLTAAVRTSAAIAIIILTCDLTTRAQATSAHQIRDLDGGPVACLVHVPQTRSASPGADRMAVDLRIPKTPESTLLARLPANKRDYSALPIQVFLVPAPAKGQVVSARLPQVTPLAADFTLRRLGLTGDEEADTFVRVEFARESLRAGVDLVAERTAAADSGERLTSQTRCRIGVIDALVWR